MSDKDVHLRPPGYGGQDDANARQDKTQPDHGRDECDVPAEGCSEECEHRPVGTEPLGEPRRKVAGSRFEEGDAAPSWPAPRGLGPLARYRRCHFHRRHGSRLPRYGSG